MKKLLILSLGMAAFTGCSSDASGPTHEDTDTLKDRTSFCKAWASAACNDEVVDSCQAADKDSCITAQRSYCINLLPAGYVSTRAEDCIAAVKRAYADAELNKAELEVVLKLGGDCGHLVAGSSAEGVSCTVSTDCNTVKS